jgi:hypothetical protein
MAFEGSHKLFRLRLEDNKLIVFPDLPYLPSLMSIEASGNAIGYIGENEFA